VALLDYLRQKVAQAFQQTRYPIGGVVHLNIPLRDPLAPIAQANIQALSNTFPSDFFEHLSDQSSVVDQTFAIPSEWFNRKGIIIAGIAAPQAPEAYCQAIGQLSAMLGYPVLAEGLTPVRNFASLQPHLITTYDGILRNADCAAELVPEIVIRIGGMPISKVLRDWLARVQPEMWIVDPSPQSIDPVHGKTRQIFGSVEGLVGPERNPPSPPWKGGDMSWSYLQGWVAAELRSRSCIDQTFAAETRIIESKVAWLLSQTLPDETPIFISNSMPVRDVECFWQPNDRQIQPFFNRGANGIDGTLSTALGVAHGGKPVVLLTGDLALLHDTNGFLIRQYLRGSLTIVLINNNGGGIFGMLPIAQFEPPFEEFFATPQHVDFADLCKTYGVEHSIMTDWQTLVQRLNPLPEQGIQVLEVRCDRTIDAPWRKQFQEKLSGNL
jgi:2-succinyl-5-enolpyruvyl-6-hydroxy-3-cyclohexene-1-carboxylate synthase